MIYNLKRGLGKAFNKKQLSAFIIAVVIFSSFNIATTQAFSSKGSLSADFRENKIEITQDAPSPKPITADALIFNTDAPQAIKADAITPPAHPLTTDLIPTKEVAPNKPMSPSLMVTSPNGNEIYTEGQQINVTWIASSISSTASIIISLVVSDQNDTLLGDMTLLVSTPNDGQQMVTLPTIDYIQRIVPEFNIVVPGRHFKILVGSDDVNSPLYDFSDDLFSISKPSSTACTINSFIVPTQTIASQLSATVSWSSDCSNVILEANSGSYTLRHAGNGTGRYTFSAPRGTTFSSADNTLDMTIIGGNNTVGAGTVSVTKSVPIINIANPASNQCDFLSLSGESVPFSQGMEAHLQWQAPAGCMVYVEAWRATPNGLESKSIFKPVTYYFNAADSVNVPLVEDSTTFYISAQAGSQNSSGSRMVLSAKTIDVKQNVSPQMCLQSTPGFHIVALNSNSPASAMIRRGATNVEFGRFDIVNTGQIDICGLNSIQIGSHSNNNLTNIRMVDASTGSQIGQTAAMVNNNGSYYYEWINPASPIQLSIGMTKTIKIVADVPLSVSTGIARLGILGTNFIFPGAYANTSMPVLGNVMMIR
ncbi:MAG: hypothetical protein V4665_01500 [Patescibacteria group bacterium]